MLRPLGPASIAWALFGLSCGDSGQTKPGVCEAKQLLVGGSPDADIMAMSNDEKRAIGRVMAAGGPPGYFCSGVLVAPLWVLTARHCDQGGAFTFEAPGDADHATLTVSVVQSLSNPDHDALLLKLGEPIDAEPVALYGESEDDATLVDAPVDIAGFGVDTDGVPVTSLNFLAERIARVDAETVVVDGHGRTGACIGDSGGPMLLRDKTGSLAVAGVLSEGAGTCTGEDHYVRADLLRAWVSATDGVTTGSGSCGSVTPVGFCRQGRPIWCEGGTLTSVSCAAGTACGFSAHAGGYRCVAPQGDACAGVDDLGKCDGDLARVCREGRVDETDCSACGAACAWNASTGRYDCLLN